MPSKHRYTVPDMEAANRLGQIAQDALKAAIKRTPDAREHAHRLFREIYGPPAAGPGTLETTDQADG